ncbi:MAG: hypothetical protein HY781_07280 [Chloroflexi bacterium]|nr:hypothetical protein [Chloroflexota bacterium]
MKKTIAILLMLNTLVAACNLSPGATPTHPAPGFGLPELVASTTQEPGFSTALPPVDLVPADSENTFWVTNPTSGARLHTRTFYPADWNGTDLLPALVLMPGGIASSDPQKAARLSGEGFIVIIFDADGRGLSEGTEDYNGFITQDGLAAVIIAVAQLPGLDTNSYGLVSYSYGVTAATGALSRHPDLPIDFYIDWEGPVDRFYTTTGCNDDDYSNIPWQPCTDNAWWSEREAVSFIGAVDVPYQRIQSEEDHVQPNNNHAIDIVNAAVAGGVPWVRLNEYPADQTYDRNNPPAMIPEVQDKQLEQMVARYAEEIINNILPTLP